MKIKNLIFTGLALTFSFLVYSAEDLSLSYGYHIRENGKGFRQDDVRHWRQEDTVKCVKENNGNLFISLFDGHGGDAISMFLKDNFYKYCTQTHFSTNYTNTQQRLQAAYKQADRNTPTRMEEDFDMNGATGSTALVGIFEKTCYGSYEFTMGWLGDSRAVVEDGGQVSFQTEDHTPTNPKEMKRIKNIPGYENEISTDQETETTRVCGVEVTRALGNKEIRKDIIIPDPQIEQMTLTLENKFVIFASDGIWHTIPSEEAIQIVAEAMTKSQEQLDNEYTDEPRITWGQLKGESDLIQEDGNGFLKRVARALAAKAVEKGSTDNISVVIVRLDKAHQSWWASQSPLIKNIMKFSVVLGLIVLGTYLCNKVYGKQ